MKASAAIFGRSNTILQTRGPRGKSRQVVLLLNALATRYRMLKRKLDCRHRAAQPDTQAPLASASTSSHVTKETLGRSTWLLLHTMAAHYPDQPDKSQQKTMRNLVCACHTQLFYITMPSGASAMLLTANWISNVLVWSRLKLSRTLTPVRTALLTSGRLSGETGSCWECQFTPSVAILILMSLRYTNSHCF